MGGIVVVGSLNMDLVVKTERMPVPGETVRGQGFQTIPGGKGANQAAAIALLGGPVSMIGRVGADAFGPRLVANLTGKGVNTSHLLQTAQYRHRHRHDTRGCSRPEQHRHRRRRQRQRFAPGY